MCHTDDEDVAFDQNLEDSLTSQEVREKTEKRQDEVVAKIREEMERIRPRAKLLLYGPEGIPSPFPKSPKDRAQALAEAKDERDFRRAVRRALKAFAVEIRADSEKREDAK